MNGKYIEFSAPNVAELKDIEFPASVEKGYVLVKTAVSTVSPGTERAVLSDSPNCGGYQHHVFPRRSGYSSAGVVEAAGEGVTSVAAGDRVVVFWGTHASYNCVPEKQTVKIPDSVSFEAAAAVLISTFSLAAIRKCRVEFGEAAMVMGCGLLGQFAVKLLRAVGAAPVIAVDPTASRREEAIRHGADHALDPTAADFAKSAVSLSGGIKVVIEVTGLGIGLDQALDCTDRFARVALLGCTRDSDFSIDYYHKVHTPGITLIGAHTKARPDEESSPGWFTQRDDIKAVLKLLDCRHITFDDMLPERAYSPAECAAVYDRVLHDRSFPTLAQFDWRKPT